ncbi:flippase [Bacillus tianshenii]|nr:flippase [Bacillus tianshenii]
MTTNKMFFKNILLTLSRQVIGILLGLGLTIIIARTLGPERQGLYALIILLPTMLATFLNMGVGVSSVYYIGKAQYNLQDIIKTNILLAVYLSAFSALIGFIVIAFFSTELFPGASETYLFTMLSLIPILFLKKFLNAIFHGMQDFKSFNSIILIGQLGNFLLVFITLIIFSLGLKAALLSYAFGHVLTLILTFSLLKQKYDFSLLNGKLSTVYLKSSLTFGLKAHLSNIMAFLNYRADLFVISFFLGPLAVGFYVVAVSITEKIWVVSEAVSSVLFPKISSITNEEERNELTSMVNRNILFLAILVGVALILLSDIFILLLFGEEYQQSSQVLKFLVLGIVLGSSVKVISNDLAGRGKPEINMYVAILTVTSNLLLNIILVPILGIYGAAIATSITYSMDWVIKLVIFKKITGKPIHTFLLVNQKDLKAYQNYLLKLKPKIRRAS